MGEHRGQEPVWAGPRELASPSAVSHPRAPPGGSAPLLAPCRLHPVPLGASVGRKRGSSLSQATDEKSQKKEVGEMRSGADSAGLGGILTEVSGKKAPAENPWGVAVPSAGEGRK